MKKNYINKILIVIISMLILSLIGCNGNSENNPENDNNNNPPETPKVLEEMDEILKQLCFDLDAVPGLEVAIAEKEERKAEISEESDTDLGSDEKEESAEDDVNHRKHILQNSILIHSLFEEEIEGHASDIEVLPGSIDDIWYEITKKFNELHKKWNILENELQEINLADTAITDFESLLDDATLYIQNRAQFESLEVINDLTYELAGFMDFFDDKVPSDVYKMASLNRKILLLSYLDAYNEARNLLETQKELVNNFRSELVQQDEAVLNMLELSIKDLEQELDKEEFELVQVKAAVVVKNIKLVQETFESQIAQ
ncbi:hypothetical protein RH915_07575 [Serpentinicella sp. ANB-PHB4]|uniref:hypothetical protein n=1 Tax=Serpentinicella sp. ANB-PHB4 TaxID=3074076 RepID=UPI0028672B11|nr:hypothetical protein [Serpentinicella sp. ANB-PHB4]MDR5659347.1 hypothetical protein [Serpentinicella sp. ANB-PHB4]